MIPELLLLAGAVLILLAGVGVVRFDDVLARMHALTKASTLGVLASGSCRNLLHRAADVCLKEGRKLVLVPRETPLSSIHLENMLRLRQAGAMIVPAMPAFYHRPADIISLVDHFVYRVMDHLGLQHSQETVWQGDV